MCGSCGHSNHKDEKCRTYVAGRGWCPCEGYLPGSESVGTAIHIPGAALKRQHLNETKAFVEKAMKGAGKPAPWVREQMQAASRDE